MTYSFSVCTICNWEFQDDFCMCNQHLHTQDSPPLSPLSHPMRKIEFSLVQFLLEQMDDYDSESDIDFILYPDSESEYSLYSDF